VCAHRRVHRDRALENLSYRERRVLELRYGLGGEHPRTLAEVGRSFNVTRERIRQIEHDSLKKLQTLREAQKLRDDVEIASGFAPRRVGHRT
jgi:RNA polymerase primary sigma factor